ncbi:MAG: FadR family transcriptional regulator [Alicyclobacillus sp.]|nr:FadR family transcriptional regulator [Alicyclobacillus sp.]
MQLSQKAYERIAEQIWRDVENGVHKPGARLDTIEQLAKRYQVGRSTIREALSLLKARGLIESVQGGGTYVRQRTLEQFREAGAGWLTSPSELKELLQVRKILEVGAISLAAMERTESDVAELGQIVEQMRHSVGDEEMSQLHDIHFHQSIARASHNRLLVNLMESLSRSMARTMRDTRKLWLYREAASAAALFEEHQQMYQAIVDHDPAAAAVRMTEHLDRVARAFDGSSP